MKKLVWALVMVTALGLIAFSVAARRQQVVPQPCPFDPDLQVGIAFQGPHRYFDTGEVQEKTINARIAWFQPVEQPNPDAFDARVYQEPPEKDWVWWNTLYPTTLIIEVTDAQSRLGSAEVWNFDLNLLDGVVKATPNGSSISGTLTLEEPAEFRRVIIKDKKNQPLAELLVRNPKTVLRLVVERAKWLPHPPKREVVVEEIKSPCPISVKGHPVQVYDEKKKQVVTAYYDCDKLQYVVKEGCPPHTGLNERHHIIDLGIYFGPHPQGCSILHIRGSACDTWVDVFGPGMPAGIEPIPLCMTKKFSNDRPEVYSEPSPQVYQTRYILQWMTLPSRADVDPADHPVYDELDKLQKSEDKTSAMVFYYEAKPYSQGCIHWDMIAVTNIYAVYAYPVEKVQKKGGDWFQRFVVNALRTVASGIFGAQHPKKNKLVEALIDAWTKDVSQRKEVKEVLEVGDLKFYGDIWILELGPASLTKEGKPDPTPKAMWEGNITQDIMVKIIVLQPDGKKVPASGSVTFQRKEAITTPSPPSPPFTSITEFIPEEGKVVSLGKGWRWEPTVTVGPKPKTFDPIEVPLTPPSITFVISPPSLPPGEGS